MGPLLFLLYINDLPSVLNPTTSCRLFADDCLIYRTINSISDQVVLQNDLKALQDWGTIWGLKFNVAKCDMMHLCVCLSSNYGTRSSQWKPHIIQIAYKANQRLGFLRRNLGGCPYLLREVGYISLVRSCLEYSGAIWDTIIKDESDRLEVIQRRAARWARGARGIISVTALLKDLKWQPLADRRCNQRLGLFYKILNNELNIPPEIVNLNISKSRTREKRPLVLLRDKGSDKHPPTGRVPSVGPYPSGTAWTLALPRPAHL